MILGRCDVSFAVESVWRGAYRLAELLPADALEDALKGLDPEEITGPGGLLT